MTAKFSAEEILEITGGRLAQGMMPGDEGAICTDTRILSEGAWFLALPGTHFDGHDFIGEVFSARGIGCIVEERPHYPIANTSFPLIAVGEPREALYDLARNWRKRLNTRVLLVLGEPYSQDHAVTSFCKNVIDRSYIPFSSEDYDYEKDETVETLLEVLEMDELTKKIGFSAVGQEVFDVINLSRVLEPNVLLVLDGGLRSLGLNASNAEIMAATVGVLSHMDPKSSCVILANTDEDVSALIGENFSGQVIRFSRDQSVTLPTTDAPLSAVHLWGAVTACRELGVEDHDITEAASQYE